MEPMLPELDRDLGDRIAALLEKYEAFGADLRASMGDRIRVIEAHYSNLLEGHDTPVADIQRALRSDYSADPMARNLQIEAKAYVEVQGLIGRDQMPFPPMSVDGIRWIHRQFCSRLPDRFLHIKDSLTDATVPVEPGELRKHHVGVGRHLAPEPGALPALLARLVEAYSSPMLDGKQRILAVPASHHRLLWIHPFTDANGRVARLFSHALLKELGLGAELWSLSRGLALGAGRYKGLLQAADEPRRGDLDGRGTLTEAGLAEFCGFFLDACIEEIETVKSS